MVEMSSIEPYDDSFYNKLSNIITLDLKLYSKDQKSTIFV